VSWEWSARRRDVPVEDAELDRRAEPYADNSSRLAESTLITQAFSSLPERWRTVLWQVEVEGERPAVVAPHFGLSANATAALARRARDGLRAAYLQAHLTQDLGATACQSVREKLGGYTAGTVKGLEGRRIKAHLHGCVQCKTLQGELREVCSALRAHAGLLVPVVGLGATAIAAHAATGGGLTAALAGKGALLATRVKLALTASSVAAVGVFGIALGPWLSHTHEALPDPSDHQIVSTYCAPSPGQSTAGSVKPDGTGAAPTSTFASGLPVSGPFKAAEGAKTAFFGKKPAQHADDQPAPPTQTSAPADAGSTSTGPSDPVESSGRVLDDPVNPSSSGDAPTKALQSSTTTTVTDTTAPTKSTPTKTTAPKKPPQNPVTTTTTDPTPTTTSTPAETATGPTAPRTPH
jgi:hypothetical protein